jgi:hypothetical protein
MYQECTDIMLAACKEFIPCVSNNKRKNEGWYNPHDVILNNLFAQRSVARKLYLASRIVVDRQSHKQINNEIVRRERTMENNFWLNKAEAMQTMFDKSDSRGLHAAAKEVFGPTFKIKENLLKSAGICLLDGVTVVTSAEEV